MSEKHYVQYDPATGEILATLSVYADNAEERDAAYQEALGAKPFESISVATAADLPDPATQVVEDGAFVDRGI